eukprot:TRINITY_DN6390_c0_g1_i1.p1 TRINITY_DN6390_c0_g1~~TRINITY_DN6390_c0_g1_i1.p1  ORF type:complete len:443 (-),score=152.76 TRINITY_DN6390_c0_g1_i1:127-1455(-)
MGLKFWKSKKVVDYESELKDIHQQITDTDQRIKLHKQSQRRTLFVLLFVLIPILEILFGTYWYFAGPPIPTNYEDTDTNLYFFWHLCGFPLIFVFIYIFSLLLKYYYKIQITRWEKKLDQSKKLQKSMLVELRDSLNFKKNFNLLIEYTQKLSQMNGQEDTLEFWSGIDFAPLMKQHEYILNVQRQLYQKQVDIENKKQREIMRRNQSEIMKLEQQLQRQQQQQQRQQQEIQNQKMREIQLKTITSTPTPSRSGVAIIPESNTPISTPSSIRMKPNTQMPPPSPFTPFRMSFQKPKEIFTSKVQKSNTSSTTTTTTETTTKKTTKKLWDEILDYVMGGEDYDLICGRCDEVYACVSEKETSQDFICRKCSALNKSSNKQENDTNNTSPSTPTPTNKVAKKDILDKEEKDDESEEEKEVEEREQDQVDNEEDKDKTEDEKKND